MNDDHGAPDLVDAPFDRAINDRSSSLLDRQIAGDDATQMQGVVGAHDRVARDAAVNVEIAIDGERTFDLSSHGLHAAFL
jgi:hypothetical protein